MVTVRLRLKVQVSIDEGYTSVFGFDFNEFIPPRRRSSRLCQPTPYRRIEPSQERFSGANPTAATSQTQRRIKKY